MIYSVNYHDLIDTHDNWHEVFVLLTRFSNGKLVIKMMNVVGRAVGQVSTIGFRSITPKSL